MSKLISKIVVPDSSEATGYALYNVKDANAIPASEKGVASGVAIMLRTLLVRKNKRVHIATK